MFFRDDQLSDLIGFEYSKWFGRDAAENFIQSLERIHQNAPSQATPVVSVILDGENAWESYPYNGFYFLDDLYSLLDNHPVIRTTTYRNYIASENIDNIVTLPTLAAGSWVYGTFSTWIGDKQKNRAWDLLCAAKNSFDLVMQSDRLTDQETAACRQLASCESSDWFGGSVITIQHILSLVSINYLDKIWSIFIIYSLPVPAAVLEPISKGNEQAEESGTMLRSS